MVILNGNIQSMSNRRGKYTKVAAYYCLIGLQKSLMLTARNCATVIDLFLPVPWLFLIGHSNRPERYDFKSLFHLL